MAITHGQYVHIVTAEDDEFPQPVCIDQIEIVGSGMLAGERLKFVDRKGATIVDYYVTGSTGVQKLGPGNGPQWYSGYKMVNRPSTGSMQITVRIR
jgi:hypothetical protein